MNNVLAGQLLTGGKSLTKLQLASKCALADLLGMVEIADTAALQTTVELFTALEEEGVDVSDYAEEVIDIRGLLPDPA